MKSEHTVASYNGSDFTSKIATVQILHGQHTRTQLAL
jgi:hypothetical protein